MTVDAVRAQALRRRVRIERKVATTDGYGGESVSYALRAEVHAEVVPMSGREPVLAQQHQGVAQYEFRIRYRTDVALTDRVVWKGQPYEVIHLAEVGRNRKLRILTKMPGGEATT